MRDCWANSLGDCSGKMSGEHLVSDALFDDDTVTVQGLPWCKDQPKIIGLSSLVKNVLCTEHNSRLSEADETAKKFRDALRAMASSQNDHSAGELTPSAVNEVDGFSIERWCAKTIVTFAAGTSARIGDGRNRGKPSRSLVEIVFGQKHFESRAGLYWMGEVGDNITVNDGVEVMVFTDSEDRVQGARFTLFGFRMLLKLTRGRPGPLSIKFPDGEVWYPKLLHHPRTLGTKNLNNSIHTLHFLWNKALMLPLADR